MQGASELSEIQARLERFRDERDWAQFHGPANLAKAISVEAAELLELFLWVSGGGEETVLRERRAAVEAELADVIIQCLNFASVTRIDVVDAVRRKIDANAEKYPVAEWKGRAGKAAGFEEGAGGVG
jgi:NTP pyrophosphatase (non-canonical NTP hydrolase)